MKKNILYILLFLFMNSCIFSFDAKDFNNSLWVEDFSYKYHIVERNQTYEWYHQDGTLEFCFPKNGKDGFFNVFGRGGSPIITNVEKISETTFEFTYYFSDIPEIQVNDVWTGKLIVIDENTITFESAPYDECTKTIYHRFTNPSKIKSKGYVTDDNVRIRSEPSTNGIIYGKVNKNTTVLILDKSKISIADGKDNYWYQIQIDNYPICWIFGEYIKIVE